MSTTSNAPSWSEIQSLRKDVLAKFPADTFLKTLLVGTLRVARDTENPIRGNFVGSGLREVIGHIFHSMAPDEEVRACQWFLQAKDTPTVTRAQRANYIVRAGLPDSFVAQTLVIDVPKLTRPLLKQMDSLNRATHVRAETILYEGRAVRALMRDVLVGVIGLMECAAQAREEVKRTVADKMWEAVFDNLIGSTIQELDELSTHTSVDSHTLEEIEITKLDATDLCYRITGQVEVELQYGSDSDVKNDMGLRQNDAYPYTASVESKVSAPLAIDHTNIDLTVDNSSFFE